MAARAIWKAELVLGEERVGVKLYSAAVDRRVHFRLLHAADGAPVEQRMVHPGTDEEVPRDERRRGVEVERGRFVLFDAGELDALAPPASRELRVERCVPAGAIDPRWFVRPYFLGPDGDGARVRALASALETTGREGVARWTMRSHAYVGALRVHAGALALVTLRNADEVVDAAGLEAPAGPDLDERELALARQLVHALDAPFEHDAYENGYRERVLELVRAKRRGERVRLRRFEPTADSGDTLLASLQASLKQAG